MEAPARPDMAADSAMKAAMGKVEEGAGVAEDDADRRDAGARAAGPPGAGLPAGRCWTPQQPARRASRAIATPPVALRSVAGGSRGHTNRSRGHLDHYLWNIFTISVACTQKARRWSIHHSHLPFKSIETFQILWRRCSHGSSHIPQIALFRGPIQMPLIRIGAPTELPHA